MFSQLMTSQTLRFNLIIFWNKGWQGGGGEGKKEMKTSEYPEKEKSFLDEITIFHNFVRAIIWWKKRNMGHKLYDFRTVVLFEPLNGGLFICLSGCLLIFLSTYNTDFMELAHIFFSNMCMGRNICKCAIVTVLDFLKRILVFWKLGKMGLNWVHNQVLKAF